MKRTITAGAAAVAAMTFLASCASSADGRRMTWSERWKAMAARQDAAARAFVDTGMEPANPNELPASQPQGDSFTPSLGAPMR